MTLCLQSFLTLDPRYRCTVNAKPLPRCAQIDNPQYPLDMRLDDFSTTGVSKLAEIKTSPCAGSRVPCSRSFGQVDQSLNWPSNLAIYHYVYTLTFLISTFCSEECFKFGWRLQFIGNNDRLMEGVQVRGTFIPKISSIGGFILNSISVVSVQN